MTVPENHPRRHSLLLRDRLMEGFRSGLTTEAGLFAHGRGEAFDYLIGERTRAFARQAIRAAAAQILLARQPVFSVNGNVAALAADELVALTKLYPAMPLEVNLFYHSAERSHRIAQQLTAAGASKVLEAHSENSTVLTGIDHARRYMHPEGVGQADVVVVALEDGDRCQALAASGRLVIAIDLNPLSRTATTAHLTIVDEVTRALTVLRQSLRELSTGSAEQWTALCHDYDNERTLADAIAAIRSGI